MAADSTAGRIRTFLEVREREIQAGRKGKTFGEIASELGTTQDYVEKVAGRSRRGRPRRDGRATDLVSRPLTMIEASATPAASAQQAGSAVPGARGLRLIRVRRANRPTTHKEEGGQGGAPNVLDDVEETRCGACNAAVDPSATSCAKCGGRFA